ncbi:MULTISPECIES: type II toxin-antitoxin system Phd/YefM family antitoxin [Pelosinus]|jgi:antitoxin YefM|uniref:Antitoxin n=1 Tax=Pelosinus fermentans B4 TaxID=1149862 RepID=I9LIR4_9FIRM|nr:MULTISPECIES: type II toxin-antitoxin system Phd/YefM family antitoxin [Pelosinus]EIW20404.1 Prevent-host-death protein [Pelosinus fermentans B4]EIW25537.1 prevent-host-death family protein [Pelosinus fermentans A11]OAM93259.1 Prevent-host-death protein [Pelosinus fermentans DSM 17108]SDQ71947.1 antitoxin YefM [Pelosinus fermentans]
MLAVNYSNVRENLKTYCDIANNDFETIIITRKQGGNVVMISEDEYNNLMENLYIRSNKKTYDRLLESIAQLKAGKGKIRELIEDE